MRQTGQRLQLAAAHRACTCRVHACGRWLARQVKAGSQVPQTSACLWAVGGLGGQAGKADGVDRVQRLVFIGWVAVKVHEQRAAALHHLAVIPVGRRRGRCEIQAGMRRRTTAAAAPVAAVQAAPELGARTMLGRRSCGPPAAGRAPRRRCCPHPLAAPAARPPGAAARCLQIQQRCCDC